jgi:uncharacterized protein YbbC (DUF1343 family)/CubicO group peptidase (beta-lactamase class C family)
LAELASIDAVAAQEVAAGAASGAVILVGRGEAVPYRRAFGDRSQRPTRAAMTPDTLFDIASLTKVVATTPAILRLADEGKLELDAPVARYWPAFAANGKESISVRQLMTHCSGLRPDIDPRVRWVGEEQALAAIAADRPLRPPGSGFSYSDANFIVLGELVRRLAGLPLDQYCERFVFAPIGMGDTGFRPSEELRARIAPSDVQGGELRWGQVQDPTAFRMGGVAGHAGLFSTADDLAAFARMILNGGLANGVRVLSPDAVRQMASPQSPPGQSVVRGLGWDIRSPYSRGHWDAFPPGSFGHTGYTGTSLWVDPGSGTYLIILANRLHPDGHGQVRSLQAKTAAIVAQATGLAPISKVPSAVIDDSPAPVSDRGWGHGQADAPSSVKVGIDVLAADGFRPLAGRRVGLVVNHTARDASGRRTVDVLSAAPGVQLVSLFSPEHGLEGDHDKKVASGSDAATGLPVYSLYGSAKRPSAEMLQGIDTLVFDIQDVGARFYTYITTLAYTMEAAAQQGLDYVVLDRPNPITADRVQGPVMDADLRSFAGYYPLPTRHGMTVGELASLFNAEARIGVRLTVVPARGYSRGLWFDETGLPWINPSPNLRSLNQAVLYPGVAMLEGANISVGRGTETPFELVGAPWIDGARLASYLNARGIRGIRFAPATFTPTSGPYSGKTFGGIRIVLVDREALDAPGLGIELIAALRRGDDPRTIQAAWQPDLKAFVQCRARYLLY